MIWRDRILSAPVDRGRPEEMREAIVAKAVARQSGHVCFANVHALHSASKDREFLEALESSFLVAPDGMPVARALSLVGPRQERWEGMSAFPQMMELAASRRISIALFGSDRATLDAVIAKAAIEIPGLRIVEAIAPPPGELPFLDDDSHTAALAQCGAGIVFVALGCPKQELWMHGHRERVPAVMLGVGNALRAWLGLEKRAPAWVRGLCLEWVVRFAQDPRRLWKRYLVSNSWFVFTGIPRLLARRFAPRPR